MFKKQEQIKGVLICLIFLQAAAVLTTGCSSRSFIGPKVSFKGEIRYPLAAQLNRTEGNVLLGVFVNARGVTEEIQIIKTSGSAVLDSAAVRYTKEIIFEPAVYNDRQIGAWTRLELRYKLQNIDFERNQWALDVNHLHREAAGEMEPSKKDILIQRIYLKYLGLVDFVDIDQNGDINKIIQHVISPAVKNKWNVFLKDIPAPFVLLEDFLYRYPDVEYYERVKQELVNQIIDMKYRIRQKALKSSRYSKESFEQLDQLENRLNELISVYKTSLSNS